MDSRAMTVRETVDARKIKYGEDDLEDLFSGAKEVVVAKGKKTLSFQPGDPDLVGVALGRSGNLRAPTVKVGKRYLVGFNAEVWEGFFA
jgi:hypothetical protein